MERSKFFRLGAHDLFKGLIVAVITALLTFIVSELKPETAIDLLLLKKIGFTAIIAAASYLLKNLFTNKQGDFLTLDK